jgi:hypothetical protein
VQFLHSNKPSSFIFFTNFIFNFSPLEAAIIDHRLSPGLDREGDGLTAVAQAPDDVILIPGDLGVDGDPEGEDEDGGKDGLDEGQADLVTLYFFE